MEEEVKGFIFYSGFIKPLKELDVELQKNVVYALVKYGIFNEGVDGLKPIEEAFFNTMKIQIDAQLQKWKKNGTEKRGNPNFEKGKTNPYYKKKEENEKDNSEIIEEIIRR